MVRAQTSLMISFCPPSAPLDRRSTIRPAVPAVHPEGVGPMRFASFNVENLFARPRALNQTTWAEGKPILDAFAEFNKLIEHVAYSTADKKRMIELLLTLDV